MNGFVLRAISYCNGPDGEPRLFYRGPSAGVYDLAAAQVWKTKAGVLKAQARFKTKYEVLPLAEALN